MSATVSTQVFSVAGVLVSFGVLCKYLSYHYQDNEKKLKATDEEAKKLYAAIENIEETNYLPTKGYSIYDDRIEIGGGIVVRWNAFAHDIPIKPETRDKIVALHKNISFFSKLSTYSWLLAIPFTAYGIHAFRKGS